ncbi:hypothetical protein TRFO_29737 [Tritrichomonas foetus]|uniref:Uncharacterized protein n=1 Tax=Tritrichomonas foetus TaxID=1144522 RepID=A0A1J4JZM0_9EUKA|nr:hypothetical protein TRFO_29737 [Tritrichomonas foetus]|eukprot:OHT02980.1 hypothetical protein TRFO_29737 [Tritrichomonas foetus]
MTQNPPHCDGNCQNCQNCQHPHPDGQEEKPKITPEMLNEIGQFGPLPWAESPPCPYPWIPEYAIEIVDKCFVKGDITYFYSLWTDYAKKFMTVTDFGRTIAHAVQNYGKFVRVGTATEPKLRAEGLDIWILNVQMFNAEDIEFFVRMSVTPEKQIGDIQFGRCCIYHTPEYIKPDRIERIELNGKEDPYIVLTKPKNFQGQFPCAVFIHTLIQKDVDLRMGFCYPARDYEFLPSVNIGLIRGEYFPEAFQNNNPICDYTAKLIEYTLMRDDVSKVFLILTMFSTLAIKQIVARFPGIISGIVLINPCWFAPPDGRHKNLTIDDVPKDIPLLLIGGGYDFVMNPKDFKAWEVALKIRNQEIVFYDKLDHFLFSSPNPPMAEEYSIFEKHVSDVPLRKIAQWIRAHSD